jgi:hypothetical protein
MTTFSIWPSILGDGQFKFGSLGFLPVSLQTKEHQETMLMVGHLLVNRPEFIGFHPEITLPTPDQLLLSTHSHLLCLAVNDPYQGFSSKDAKTIRENYQKQPGRGGSQVADSSTISS